MLDFMNVGLSRRFVWPSPRSRGRLKAHGLTAAAIHLIAVNGLTAGYAQVEPVDIDHPNGYIKLEVIHDRVAHVHFGFEQEQAYSGPIRTSPMVLKSDWTGPKSYSDTEQGKLRVIETSDMRLEINTSSRCLSFYQNPEQPEFLTTLCPTYSVSDGRSGLDINPTDWQDVYGLGQMFMQKGTSDGSWVDHGSFQTQNPYGNMLGGFWGGATGQTQFPIMYALNTTGEKNFALFYDNAYKQEWNLQNFWWNLRSYGEVRFYFMIGQDLRTLRKDYMGITGHSPVPPKSAFGLWVSEFGYENWAELEADKNALQAERYPLEGFFLDLQWFGGARRGDPNSPMGTLTWDEVNFANPKEKIAEYRAEGLSLITIEESYVARNLDNFRQLLDIHDGKGAGGLVHFCNTNDPWIFSDWPGEVGMIDWVEEKAGAFWHDQVRKPNLVDLGIVGHWTDLGEPERFSPYGCYAEVEPGRYQHQDVHNLYNFYWHKSIYEGYVRNHSATHNQRPYLLARSGAPGIQRFGAGMWSGDIASRLDVLATHYNMHMHMSFAGIDYYGSDTGGFWRAALYGYDPGGNWLGSADSNVVKGYQPYDSEMFAQWLANAAWFDIPLRPHVFNCGFEDFVDPGISKQLPSRCPYNVSPTDWTDPFHVASNKENIRTRYRLIPYYYSLAHKAHLEAEPLIAPMIMYFQQDARLKDMGHQKMIGEHLMVASVSKHGQRQRDVYLPQGTWTHLYTGQTFPGNSTIRVQLDSDQVFRLPAFLRSGAIVPMMWVDEQTKNTDGLRHDGTKRDELIVRITLSKEATAFTLYEDDGRTVKSYDSQMRPVYEKRTSTIRQVLSDENTATLNIGPAQGEFNGSVDARNTELRVSHPSGKPLRSVSVNGVEIPSVQALADLQNQSFAETAVGWFVDTRGVAFVRTGKRSVDIAQTIVLQYQ